MISSQKNDDVRSNVYFALGNVQEVWWKNANALNPSLLKIVSQEELESLVIINILAISV